MSAVSLSHASVSANVSALDNGPYFDQFPDLVLKGILGRLPKADIGGFNFLKTRRALFFRVVYGVPRDKLDQVKRLPTLPSGKSITAKQFRTKQFRRSVLAQSQPVCTFQLEVFRLFVEKIEKIFADHHKIDADEFHDILGRDLIRARYPETAEVKFYSDYVQHICLVLLFGKLLDQSHRPKFHALLNWEYIENPFQNIIFCLRNQKSSLRQLKEVEALKYDSLSFGNRSCFEAPLASIPPYIGKLEKMKGLNFYQCHLKILPIEFSKLVNLNLLSLSGNQFTCFPLELCQLINLKHLSMTENQISALPVEIGNLVNLETLKLSQNKLTELPKEIGKLVSLVKLHLTKNQLRSLPPEIGNLEKLKQLCLTCNNLESLPSEIGNLESLEELFLATFSTDAPILLPAEMIRLKKLHYIQLSRKTIEEPANIRLLESLKTKDPKCDAHRV